MCIILGLILWIILAAYVAFVFCGAANLGEEETDGDGERGK